MSKRRVLAVLVSSLLLSLSPLAAETDIRRGIDIFTTPADGRTYYDFSQNPIPAGFFCDSSQTFTGRVAFKGLPLATAAPGQLWGGDTVIERLDNAVFDAKGNAETRIQFRALSLVSIAPLKTSCGAFHVYVSLGGQQRVTKMSILRTQDNGGSFVAPLAVNARMTFVPVKSTRNKAARKLTLAGRFTFPATPLPWSLATSAVKKTTGSVVVDTNGDQTPDTRLPGTSNFASGRSPVNLTGAIEFGDCCMQCHTYDEGLKQHCTYPSYCTHGVLCANTDW
jgi:hypothetical protein